MTNVTATSSQNKCLGSRQCLDSQQQKIVEIARWLSACNDLGQALVETALTIPLLLVLVFGAAEFGRLAYAAIEVSNAAHAGVAYGAQSHITASDFTGMETAATKDGADVSSMTATATNFCACSSAPSAQVSCTTVITSCSPAPLHSLEYVQVNTTATVHPMFNYPGISKTFTLTGQAVMRVEQ